MTGPTCPRWPPTTTPTTATCWATTPWPPPCPRVPEGPHRYVVVMTVGYRTDAVALRQLLGRRYAYLGVMGSAAKVAELRRALLAAGFSADEVAHLRGPIGVPINSRTPEEIAVSVAAELIAVRNASPAT